jgi:alpha-glucosidase
MNCKKNISQSSITKTFLTLSLICISLKLIAVGNNPVATPLSVIQFGKARFTMLTPSLVRMEWSPDCKFEDKASFTILNRQLPVPAFTKKVSGKKLIITTKDLTISFTDDNNSFSAKNLQAQFKLNGKKVVWTVGLKDSLNLKGTIRTLDRFDSITPTMLEDGILSRSGWALVDDSKQLLFDGAKPTAWLTSRKDTVASKDLYLFAYGHRYKEAMADFVKVAGQIPIPPKYAFGYWFSRYFCVSDTEVKDMVKNLERYDVPIDVFVVDMDWHKTYGISELKRRYLGWSGYSWDKNLFPNPEGFLSWMHDRKIKISLNLHPAEGIYYKEDCFNDFAKTLGKDTTGVKTIKYDLENKKWGCLFQICNQTFGKTRRRLLVVGLATMAE